MTDHPLESGRPLRPRRGLLRSLLIGAAAAGLSMVVLLTLQLLVVNSSVSWSDAAVDAASCVAFGAVLGWVAWATRTWRAALAVAAAVLAGVLTPVLLVMSVAFSDTWVTGAGAGGNFTTIGPPVAPMSLKAADNAWNNAVLAALFIGVFLAPLGGVVGVAAGVAGRFRRT